MLILYMLVLVVLAEPQAVGQMGNLVRDLTLFLLLQSLQLVETEVQVELLQAMVQEVLS